MSHYRKAMPLAKILRGRALGRSLRPIREKAQALMDDADTAELGHRLHVYCSLISMAESLQPDNLKKKSATEISKAVKAMQEEKQVLPENVNTALMEHAMKGLLARNAPADDCLSSMCPWSSPGSTFDPLQPQLGSLGIPLEKRIELFRTWFWRKMVIPWLSDVDTHMDRLVSMCSHLIATFEMEDLVMLENAAATILSESLLCAKAILVLLDFSPDPDANEPLQHIASRIGKTDRSVSTCVCCAVQATPRLAERLSLMIASLPIVLEVGPEVKGFMQELGETISHDTNGFTRLQKMISTYALVNSSAAAQLFEAFGAKVFAATMLAFKNFESGVHGGTIAISMELLNAAKGCLAEASTAWAFSHDELVVAQASLEQLVCKYDGEARSGQLSNVCSMDIAKVAFGSDEWVNFLTGLTSACNDCNGCEIPKKVSDQVVGAIQAALSVMAPHILIDGSMLSHVDETLEALGVASILVGVSTELVSVSRTFAKLCDGVAELRARASVVGGDPRQRQSSLEASVHDLEVLAMQGDASLATLRSQPTDDAMKSLVDRFRATITEAKGDIFEQARASLTLDLESLALLRADILVAAPPLASTQHWHNGISGVSDAAWKKICNAADAQLVSIDTKLLDKTLANMESTLARAKETSARHPGVADDSTAQNMAALDAFAARTKLLLYETKLMWHLRNEHDKDELRTKVQAEVRGLRKANMPEKDVLHEAIFVRLAKALRAMPSKS